MRPTELPLSYPYARVITGSPLPSQDLQLVAERCILQGLKGAGIVRGDVEDMLQRRVAALFMPHGQ